MTLSTKTSKSARRRRSRLSAILSFLPAILITAWLIFDDVIDALLSPALRHVSKWPLAVKAENWARGLGPYPALALLLLPAIVIEPAKLVAVYLLGEGHYISGVVLLLAAFSAGIVFLERVFELNRGKILSIAWFAAFYRALTRMRDALYLWAKRTGLWRGLARHFRRRRASRVPVTSAQRRKPLTP